MWGETCETVHKPSVRKTHAKSTLFESLFMPKNGNGQGGKYLKRCLGKSIPDFLSQLKTWETCFLAHLPGCLHGFETFLSCCLVMVGVAYLPPRPVAEVCDMQSCCLSCQTGWSCIHTTKTCCKYMDEWASLHILACYEMVAIAYIPVFSSLHDVTWLP